MKPQELREWVLRYYDHRELFVREVLGADPYDWQCEVLAKMDEGQRRLCIPTGHGVGKTALASWAALHFVLTRIPCKVIVTAPSSATLEDGLFAEIELWHGRLPTAIKDMLEVKADRVELRSAPAKAFITARTSRAEKPEALAGIHADHVLLVADEASGIPDEVFSAGQGSMSASTACTLMIGNPTRATGYFASAVNNEAGIWWVREVSVLDVVGKHPNAPGPEFAEEAAAIYGIESNTYRYRVLGKLPLSDDDVLIPRALVDPALTRDVAPSTNAPMYWGLDVARLGRNESALAKRRGNHMPEPVQLYRGLDTMQTCGRIKAMYDGCKPEDKPAEILIDGIGLGAGVVDRLRELGLPAVGINVSERKSHDNAYYNLKAELWYTARGWFASQMVKMVNDPSLIYHLTCVKSEPASDGRLIVEPKSKTLKRIGDKETRRLDDADAFILTFAGQAAAAAYGSSNGSNWKTPLTRGIQMLA